MPSALVENIELAPLSYDAVVSLSQSAEQATRIWDLSAGNPFHVKELLKGRRDEIPASVRDMVRSHLGRLTAKAEQLVQLAAVTGGAELSLLAETSEDHGEEPARTGSAADRFIAPIMVFVATKVINVANPIGRKVRDHFLHPPRGIPRAGGTRKRILEAGEPYSGPSLLTSAK